ncbi:hypothetical protein [Salinigranum sp. GCM10025319]|uniref:DUF7857 domain-containing protein n=1 Tax=Salinigranum sp. GCM10025319 TaxID=3252687 RepID=UPI00361FC82F
MTTPTERTRETEREGGGGRTRDGDRGTIEAGAVAVDWHVSRVDGTTLVTVRVTNTVGRSRRVRVDNLLDGPISPPRRRGVAERGWDDDGVTRTVPGDGTLSIGYACRAPPETPPVAVRDAPPEDHDETPVDRALRSLGDHAPPRAALATDPEDGLGDSVDPDDRPDTDERSDTDVELGASNTDSDTDATADEATDADDGSSAGSQKATYDPEDDPTTGVGPDDSPPDQVPSVVAAWFDAIEARLVTADRLSGDVREATPVIASLGGQAGVETLAATLDDDAAALHRVADRAAALAKRVEESEVPDVEAER